MTSRDRRASAAAAAPLPGRLRSHGRRRGGRRGRAGVRQSRGPATRAPPGRATSPPGCWRRPPSRSPPRRRCSAPAPDMMAIEPAARREREAHPRTLKTFRYLRAYPGCAAAHPARAHPRRVPDRRLQDLPRARRLLAALRGLRAGDAASRMRASVSSVMWATTPSRRSRIASSDPNARCRQCHGPAGRLGTTSMPHWTGGPTAWPQLPRMTAGPRPTRDSARSPVRGNCLACHAGPAAVAEIRTTHPEWADCRQCHVAPEADAGDVHAPGARRRRRKRRRAMSRTRAGAAADAASGSGVHDRRLLRSATRRRGTTPPPGADTLRPRHAGAPRPSHATLEPGALATVPAAPVERWNGPGDRPFEVAIRTSEREAGHVAQVRLHHAADRAARAAPSASIPAPRVISAGRSSWPTQRIADAHQNIQPVHPAADGRRLLDLPCGRQRRAAGAQERRARDAWIRATACARSAISSRQTRGPAARTASGSTAGRGAGSSWVARDCHDPHKPAVEPRIPFRAPQHRAHRRPRPMSADRPAETPTGRRRRHRAAEAGRPTARAEHPRGRSGRRRAGGGRMLAAQRRDGTDEERELKRLAWQEYIQGQLPPHDRGGAGGDHRAGSSGSPS